MAKKIDQQMNQD